MLLTTSAEGTFLREQGRTLKLTERGAELVADKQFDPAATSEIVGLLGTIQLKVGKYLITINAADSFGLFLGHEVLKVASTSIIPLNSYSSYDSDEHVYLNLLRFQLDSSNLFFSRSYDLTNSVQRNFDKNLAIRIGFTDSRFFWNEFLSKDLLNLSAKDRAYELFITPVISGYAKILQETVNGKSISFGLITRRSRYRAGTRYFRRGINDKGQVANFNETEQIVVHNDTIYSYLQTRGSVPVYWAEVNNLKYKPHLSIGQANSVEAGRRHFDEQTSLYGKNYLVNLVNQKGYELPVKNAYENLVKSLGDDQLQYIYFDFHHECRKMQWHNVYLLLETLQQLGLSKDDYFIGTVSADAGAQTIRKQQHIVRTNCMDCLDRTNVVQSTLGRFFLQNQLENAQIVQSNQKWDLNIKLNLEFQNFWADNADAVSSVYSGTGALKTDFTRTGTRTRRGALADLQNSITRYVKNNYKDGSRQDSFDLILGEFVPSQASTSPFVDFRPYQFQYILSVFLFFVFILAATFLKGLVYGLQTKQHVLIVIAFVGLLASGAYMSSNGMQVVNWPRLKPLEYLKTEPVYQGKELLGHKYVKNPEY